MASRNSYVRDALERLYDRFYRQMDDRQKETLRAHLTGPYLQDYEATPELAYGSAPLAKRMNELLRAAPRMPRGITAYRGEPDKHVRAPGHSEDYPVVTSLDQGNALSYAESNADTPAFWTYGPKNPPADVQRGHIMELEVPPGAPGLVVTERMAHDLSPFGFEEEFVLPRSEFKTLEERPVTINDYRSWGYGHKAESTLPQLTQSRRKVIPPYARGGILRRMQHG